MTQSGEAKDKVENPSNHFEEPHDVVVDPSLSGAQKSEALDTLEQDARQMSDAAAEGMGGGERSKLHEVLEAKAALAAPRGVFADIRAWFARLLAP